MPVLVNCPSCAGPLRVADDLIGRKVRCPACQTVFEAVAPGSSNGDLPLETERIDSWKNLDLEMTRDPEPAPAPTSPPPRLAGLVGAVEVDPGPQEPPRRPTPREERPVSRRADDDEDLRPCPDCGKMLHADSTRCFSCGARLTTRRESRPVRYRDDRIPPRRDCEPHRGTMVLVMGIMSLVCLMLIGCLPVIINLPGAILGVIAWWMGQADLAKMNTGTMDPEGRGTTQGGWICGILGTILNTLFMLFCGAWIGFMIYHDINQAQQQQPGFRPPPPAVRPGQKDKW